MKFIDEPKTLGKRSDPAPVDPHARQHNELIASIKTLTEAVRKHTDPALTAGALDLVASLESLREQFKELTKAKARKKWKFTVSRGSNGLIQSIKAE